MLKWFSNSETILWARIQTALGVVASIVTFVEPSVIAPILPAEWFPYLLVANGVFTEVLRRLRASDL
jgi:hypothetical protein